MLRFPYLKSSTSFYWRYHHKVTKCFPENITRFWYKLYGALNNLDRVRHCRQVTFPFFNFRFWRQTDVRLSRNRLKLLYHICQLTIREETSCYLLFNLDKNVYSTINENDAREYTWHTLTSEYVSFTGILMHFPYKENMYWSYIILRELVKNKTLESGISSNFVWGTVLGPTALWWLIERKVMSHHD